MPHIHIC